jgi:hypothetical protein
MCTVVAYSLPTAVNIYLSVCFPKLLIYFGFQQDNSPCLPPHSFLVIEPLHVESVLCFLILSVFLQIYQPPDYSQYDNLLPWVMAHQIFLNVFVSQNMVSLILGFPISRRPSIFMDTAM